MKMPYENGADMGLPEDGIPHCTACGRCLKREWRFYVKDGIPYCRECILSFPLFEILRICEKEETGWLLDHGFEAWGRIADGGY